MNKDIQRHLVQRFTSLCEFKCNSMRLWNGDILRLGYHSVNYLSTPSVQSTSTHRFNVAANCVLIPRDTVSLFMEFHSGLWAGCSVRPLGTGSALMHFISVSLHLYKHLLQLLAQMDRNPPAFSFQDKGSTAWLNPPVWIHRGLKTTDRRLHELDGSTWGGLLF